jgi:hypothetical protein
MKLYLKSDDPNNNNFIQVDFFSFMKCMFLTNLALTSIIYGTIILLAFMLGAFA